MVNAPPDKVYILRKIYIFIFYIALILLIFDFIKKYRPDKYSVKIKCEDCQVEGSMQMVSFKLFERRKTLATSNFII